MPLNRPNLKDLIDRSASDLESRIEGADARTRRTNLTALARQSAGAAHGIYGKLESIERNLWPDTCDASELDRAALWRAGITRNPAVVATGNVTLTGTNGTIATSGTELVRSDGARYATTADATIAAGTATVAVTATMAGAAGNAAAATTLSLAAPLAGVNTSVVVAAGGVAGGADIESDDAFRSRLMDVLRTPPLGGTETDYVTWSREVSGVTRAWAKKQILAANSISVWVMTDGLTVDGIPSGATVTAVQGHLDAMRPVGAAPVALAPVANPLNLTISLTPSTQAVRDAVTAAIKAMLADRAEPGGTIYLSWINEAISQAEGESDHIVTAPVANVTNTGGAISTIGTITWA